MGRNRTPNRRCPKWVSFGERIKSLAVVSDGREFENPKALKKAQAKLTRLQRELSRRKNGGKNRGNTKRKIAKAHCKIANIRKDTLHKATSAITAKNKPDSERPAVVVIEDLNVNGMAKNHCLAQAVSDAGMGEFRRQLVYKTAWNGENLMVADRFFPSSRLCPACGTINDELTLADRIWACHCGARHDRDLNAAINLRNLAVRRVPLEQACVMQANVCGEERLQASASAPHRSRNQTSDLPMVDSSRF